MPNPDAKWNRLNRQTIACDLCPRLRRHCAAVAEEKRRAYLGWEYWGQPVPNFGDPSAKLLIVGLAPGPMALTARAACSPATVAAIGCIVRCTAPGSLRNRTPRPVMTDLY